MTERVRPDGTVVDQLGNFLGIDQPAASKLLRHGNPKGGPAPSLPHGAARDTNQEDTP